MRKLTTMNIPRSSRFIRACCLCPSFMEPRGPSFGCTILPGRPGCWHRHLSSCLPLWRLLSCTSAAGTSNGKGPNASFGPSFPPASFMGLIFQSLPISQYFAPASQIWLGYIDNHLKKFRGSDELRDFLIHAKISRSGHVSTGPENVRDVCSLTY